MAYGERNGIRHVLRNGTALCDAEIDEASELDFEPQPLRWRCRERRLVRDAVLEIPVSRCPTPLTVRSTNGERSGARVCSSPACPVGVMAAAKNAWRIPRVDEESIAVARHGAPAHLARVGMPRLRAIGTAELAVECRVCPDHASSQCHGIAHFATIAA